MAETREKWREEEEREGKRQERDRKDTGKRGWEIGRGKRKRKIKWQTPAATSGPLRPLAPCHFTPSRKTGRRKILRVGLACLVSMSGQARPESRPSPPDPGSSAYDARRATEVNDVFWNTGFNTGKQTNTGSQRALLVPTGPATGTNSGVVRRRRRRWVRGPPSSQAARFARPGTQQT